MNDTALAPNQHATFDEYDRAMRDHNREAAHILHQMLGAVEYMVESGADAGSKARTFDTYAQMARDWDAVRPEWVR